MEKIPKCRMTVYPPLTISLLSQLTDRELQSNYLNHLDRTPEIATLLTQISDGDLALRIVNLALEVDLCLGAKLTASVDPTLQQIVVDAIECLEIPTRLKIALWQDTKSKTALPYLQKIFIYNGKLPNTWEGHQEIDAAISTIISIDRDLAVTLLLEELNHPRRYDRAAETIADLAPVEAIDALGELLQTGDRRNCRTQYHSIQALVKIGTTESLDKLRDVFHNCQDRWSDDEWIQGLGIIAEPAMVEHLLELLYLEESDRLQCEAIDALEHLGRSNTNVFDWLYQSVYWISNIDEFCRPFQKVVMALFNLDRSRILTALEDALESYDPVVRKYAAMALVAWDVPICDRNLSILLNALDDLDLEVQIIIIRSIVKIVDLSRYVCCTVNITPQLIDRAILETNAIILKYINHPDVDFRDRVISQLSPREVDEWQSIAANKEPDNLSTLLELLSHPEIDIRESALIDLVDLGSVEIFAIVLELASNPELVATLIWGLQQSHCSATGGDIFDEFHRDREFTMKFLETAENTLIEAIENNIGYLCPNMFRLGEIGSDRAIPTLQKIIRSDAYAYYDEPEDALRSLATIGTDAARMAVLEVFTDRPDLGRSIFDIFSEDGRLGLIPQLSSALCQTYFDGALHTISTIQEREGLYNPDFSDRSHPLFAPYTPRLRHFLLGDNSISSPA